MAEKAENPELAIGLVRYGFMRSLTCKQKPRSFVGGECLVWQSAEYE